MSLGNANKGNGGTVACGLCHKKGHNRRTCGAKPPIMRQSVKSKKLPLKLKTNNPEDQVTLDDFLNKIGSTAQPSPLIKIDIMTDVLDNETSPSTFRNLEDVVSVEENGEYSKEDLETLWSLMGGDELQTAEKVERGEGLLALNQNLADRANMRIKFNTMFSNFSKTYYPHATADGIASTLENLTDYDFRHRFVYEMLSDEGRIGNYIRFLNNAEGPVGIINGREVGIVTYLASREKLVQNYPQSFALNSEVPVQLLEHFVAKGSDDLVGVALGNNKISPDTMVKVFNEKCVNVEKPNAYILHGIASNSLVANGNILTNVYNIALSAHKNGKINDDDMFAITRKLATNSSTNEKIRTELAHSPDVLTRAGAARFFREADETFRTLAQDYAHEVRMGVLSNYFIPTEEIEPVVKQLTRDKKPEVAATAQERLNYIHETKEIYKEFSFLP